MQRIGFLLFVLWTSLSLGQRNDQKDCINQECQYVFVLATRQDVVERFINEVRSIQGNGLQAFDVDISRFAPLLSTSEVQPSVVNPETPNWLRPYLEHQTNPNEFYGFLFPLYFKSTSPTDYIYDESNVITNPCQALMAFVKDINNLTGDAKREALAQLDEVRETLNRDYGGSATYGPNPETLGGAGADSQKESGFNYLDKVDSPQYFLQGEPQEPQQQQPPSSSVTIAVIDTGVDSSSQVVAGFNLVDGIPPENFSDSYRYDSEDKNGNPIPNLQGHGTQVAQIATKTVNDISQEDLIAPNIMPVKVCANNGTRDENGNEIYGDDCRVSDIIIGVCYALNNVDPNHRLVINLSLGGEESVDILGQALWENIDANTVVVASGGNDQYILGSEKSKVAKDEQEHEERYYPAAFQCRPSDCSNSYENNGLISVSSVDGNDAKSEFSVAGDYNDVASLGEDMPNFQNRRGTSFATPVISGLAAAILTKYPNATPYEVEACLRGIAERNPPPESGLGTGIIKPTSQLFSAIQSECNLTLSSQPENPGRLLVNIHRPQTPLAKDLSVTVSKGSYSYKITKPFEVLTLAPGEYTILAEELYRRFGSTGVCINYVQSAGFSATVVSDQSSTVTVTWSLQPCDTQDQN